MKINHIGICGDSIGRTNKLVELEQALAHYAELGFSIVEVDPIAFGLIINGQIRRPQLANFAAVLNNFNLRYSVHGPNRLNLAYDPRHVTV